MKPITYYLDNRSIAEITQNYGQHLESIPDEDKPWLAAQVTEAMVGGDVDIASLDVSPEAWEVHDRVGELDDSQLIALISAFTNAHTNKPIGYWGADRSNELVKDIAESWGECLNFVSTTDKYWLISHFTYQLWARNESPVKSNHTLQLKEKLQSLDFETLQALLFQIVN
jgi:hypothetical protein